MSGIASEIVDEVRDKAGVLGGLPPVKLVAVSLGYSLVELECGKMGICFTPRTAGGSCAHYARAGSLGRMSVLDLAELMTSGNQIERSVGIAAVNVVSQMIMEALPDRYRFAEEDVLDLLPRGQDVKKAGMLGHIGPFIPILRQRYESVMIVDDNPELTCGEKGRNFIMSRNLDDLADADVLIITGSSAAVGDFDRVVGAAESARFIAVVGPSAGWLPEPAFRRGVHAVAATKIKDVAGARAVILEGGGTPQFMKYGEKYTVVRS